MDIMPESLISSATPTFPPPTSAAEPASFVLLGDVLGAIYRDVCYCVRPCERHKEPEQAAMFPVEAPGSLMGGLKYMWGWHDEPEKEMKIQISLDLMAIKFCSSFLLSVM